MGYSIKYGLTDRLFAEGIDVPLKKTFLKRNAEITGVDGLPYLIVNLKERFPPVDAVL